MLGVDTDGPEITMAQKVRNVFQGCSFVQQMRGTRVAKRVDPEVPRRNSKILQPISYDHPERR